VRPFTALEQAARFVILGGVTVYTPPDKPFIKTLIQLDGDMVTIVDRSLLADANRDRIRDQHFAALQKAVSGTARLGPALRAFNVALYASVTGAELSHFVHAAGWRVFLSASALLQTLTWPVVVYLMPLTLRWAVPWAIRHIVSRRTRRGFAAKPK